MINTTVLFYNVGLNEKNLAYNWNTLSRILAAGIITDNGQAYELHLTALPFGQVFNISQDVYDKVKTATYIVIENTNPEKPNATPDARACFINNFLQLANGNWSVSYTIDDWASFYLNPDSPYNMHIDGFTERANVPLINANNEFLTTSMPLTGATNDKGMQFTQSLILRRPGNPSATHGKSLPQGYTCAVYFINNPKYNGTHSGAGQSAQGTVLDYDIKSAQFREIPRNNSSIYYMVFDSDGYNVGIYGKNNENDNYQEIVPRGKISIYEPDDSTIEKIMYFDFIPTDDNTAWNNGFQQITYDGTTRWGIAVAGTTDNNLKLRLADITHGNDNVYYKALRISKFAPVMGANIADFSIIRQKSIISKENQYQTYIDKSLYKNIDELRKIKLKFLTTEIEVPIFYLNDFTTTIVTFSGDGETAILKLGQLEYPINLKSNIFSATGQNTAYFDLTLVRDFKAYKNAKITGAAGIASTAIGTITAFGASVASGNIPGVVGALSGGAQGIIGGIQKLQGVTPSQQSPANGDKTLTDITNDTTKTGQYLIYLIEECPQGDLENQKAKDLEENGAAVAMAFDEYIDKCQMQAFNAIKMAIMDVTGAPQQICRRIEEIFLNGVTLWTATDVGNKKVINYPLNS